MRRLWASRLAATPWKFSILNVVADAESWPHSGLKVDRCDRKPVLRFGIGVADSGLRLLQFGLAQLDNPFTKIICQQL
jgi:hypothetical protein